MQHNDANKDQESILRLNILQIKFISPCIIFNFRGVQFSRFSRISGYPQKLDPRNMYDCTVYIGQDRTRPQNLNRENFEAIRENWTPRKFSAIRYMQA
jgi:hypothetical protein